MIVVSRLAPAVVYDVSACETTSGLHFQLADHEGSESEMNGGRNFLDSKSAVMANRGLTGGFSGCNI
ncbi:hypothetical protein Csa_005691 [Cucumis sativus]|uniref:Uncharacterized protein n=1 Tax=Cucumis sativus TaxID=3659 RepID=A0A0A0KBK7_CUCSA|nr:hypothetical protein Csa_005691 [Cucumis sativus]